MTFCMNVSRFMNLAAIFSLDLESQSTAYCLQEKYTVGTILQTPALYITQYKWFRQQALHPPSPPHHLLLTTSSSPPLTSSSLHPPLTSSSSESAASTCTSAALQGYKVFPPLVASLDHCTVVPTVWGQRCASRITQSCVPDRLLTIRST